MNDKLICLNFKTKKADNEQSGRLTCKICRNKTFIADYTPNSLFPLLVCASCGQHVGHFGWANTETEK